jgi:hypothetical protein
VEQVPKYLGKALIGKLFGRFIFVHILNDWIQRVWAPILGYGLVFHLLTRGWIGFNLGQRRFRRKYWRVDGIRDQPF